MMYGLWAGGTRAVPSAQFIDEHGYDARALCPGHPGGRLNAYSISMPLAGWGGFDIGEGWIARCAGSLDGSVAPCGFTMQISPRQVPGGTPASYLPARPTPGGAK